MATAPPNNKRTLIAAVAVLIVAGYRLASPYMEETKTMRTKIADLKGQIKEVRDTAAMYGKGWEKSMAEKEKKSADLLPDTLNSSAVLGYFLSGFESQSAGRVWFLSVNHQNGGNSQFSTGRGRDVVAARAERYKIRAQLDQERVVPYLEYMEKYAGLFRASEFSFSVPKEKAVAGLEMDVNLEFYLSPIQWVKSVDVAKAEEKKGEAGRSTANEEPAWTQIFISRAAEALGRPLGGGRNLGAASGKIPSIDSIVGRSIVVDETLYEEGDSIHGWKIVEVDPRKQWVLLKTGGTLKKVRVR